MSDPAANPGAQKLLPAELEQLARTPLLPIEKPLVQAVRSLEALRGQIDLLLLLLEQMPGETAQIANAVNVLTAHGNAAIAQTTQFNEIRSCKGQG